VVEAEVVIDPAGTPVVIVVALDDLEPDLVLDQHVVQVVFRPPVLAVKLVPEDVS
jgi:hypothetical protein